MLGVSKISAAKDNNRILSGSSGLGLCALHLKQNVSAPYAFSFRHSVHSTQQKDDEARRFSLSMNFVRGVVDEDGRDFRRITHFPRPNVEQNADIVHIKLKRNNSFISMTDSKGNTLTNSVRFEDKKVARKNRTKKYGKVCTLKASGGNLKDKDGEKTKVKLSRYNADAIAEQVGRAARERGLTSAVVMKVNGFIHFKKKRQAIMSWIEGFNNSRRGQNPVVYIEDTTRRPHNGCRLPKKRRI